MTGEGPGKPGGLGAAGTRGGLRLLASSSPGEVRVALVRGGVLLDYAIERPGAPDGMGDLHRGRVSARRPALGGSFVALGGAVGRGGAANLGGNGGRGETAHGFLPDSEGAEGLAEGALVGVRIVRAAQGGKGPRLTARLGESDAEAGTGRRRLVSRGPGALQRLARAHPAATIVTDDPALLVRVRAWAGGAPPDGAGLVGPGGRTPAGPGSAAADATGGPLLAAAVFDDALEAEIESLSGAEAWLPGGLRASIHPTPALVAIDVDGGTSSNARAPKPAAQREANRAALPALVRQIVLRNLSGAILVDLAGLSSRRRASLGPALAEALAADPLGAKLLGFTALGLAEIVRARVHPPLHEVLAGPHAAGLAALRAVARAVAAEPAVTRALRAAPDVVAALQSDPAALADLAHRAGRALILRSDPALGPGTWTMEEGGD